jgi:hypothetical protein
MGVTVAMPLALVVAEPPTTLPPPAVTVNVTLTPLFGLLNASRTITLGAIATAVFLVAVCPLPALIAICVALPAVAEAVNVSGLPVRPALVAEIVLLLVPATVPSVQLAMVAMPLAFVATVNGPPSEPPPPVTANVTFTPATGLLPASRTITLGAVATFAFTAAV